jgi:integrase
MEALRLTVGDVDLEQGVLRISQAKNNKERFVPMAESLTKCCMEYKKIMHENSTDSDYFFPGFHGGCYSNSTIYVRFRQYLWKAGISHTGRGPRLHDFRHVYCVHRLKKWIMAGEELTNLLPYLSVYLGHSDFRGTEYYLKLTADLYPEIISMLEKSHGYIIPESGVDIT